jgi:hypothetical protein
MACPNSKNGPKNGLHPLTVNDSWFLNMTLENAIFLVNSLILMVNVVFKTKYKGMHVY